MSVRMAARALLNQREASAGLVGSVYRDDPARGAVFVAQVTVPMVDFASGRMDRIRELEGAPSGRYLLQLLLPNGQVASQGFEIVAGRDTPVVVDVPHEGPAEWTSLHALKGAFSAVARFAMPPRLDSVLSPDSQYDVALNVESIRPPRDYAALRGDPEHGFALRFVPPQAAGAGMVTPSRIAEMIRADLTVAEAEAVLGPGVEVATPVQEGYEHALFEFVHAGALGDAAQRGWFHFGPGTDLARAYLLVSSARGASLVCLPVPWTREGEEVEVELLLDKSLGDGAPRYSLTIGDPMINTALGYINNGALHEASRLIDFETARDLLFNKISSPLAATIGGYLLVLGLDRSAYRERSADWKDWIDNLANWFEWLPDGAILRSALYVVLGDKDRDGAYRALIAACDRGLPFFTFGLRLLLEGLRRFANEGEADAARRLALFESIAQVSDPAHNFLSIDIAQRWRHEQLPR